MTISPACLDKPLPFTIDLPRAVETHLYRYIAQDDHAASFVCRVMPATEKPATTFTLRFDGLDHESLSDYFKSEDDMIEGLSYLDAYDVIERAVALWSNPGDAVVSPFAGVGSEVYGAVINGRRGIGIELKSSYYKQALRNLEEAEKILAGSRATGDRQVAMFGA